MRRWFEVGEERTHVADDATCRDCPAEYPARCACGGLIHASLGEPEADDAEAYATRCDRCGRSEEEMA